MSNEVISFSLPRLGEAEKNIQDRFEISSDGSLAAMADGAGSSLYPGKWADILVKSFCQDSENPIQKIQRSYCQWLKPLQEEWRQYYLAKVLSPNKKWWQGGSTIKDHGSATFIGLRLQNLNNEGKKKWQVVAIGDSCLFKLESEPENLIVFPIKNSKAFKSTTQCFESLPQYQSFSPSFDKGSYQNGDIFLLATDALAQWLLTDYENDGKDWRKVFAIREKKEFV